MPTHSAGDQMPLKPDATDWTIKEQVLEDRASGLTFQFEHASDDAGAPFRLRIFGALPFGNRELLFGPDGTLAATGTFVGGLCKPSWTVKNES